MRITCFVIVAATLTASSSARAVPKSPVSIQQQLGLSYQPPCSICHSSKGVPNAGDVTSSFAQSMLANGLKPNDRPAMNAALAALEAAKTDSDGDGFTDIAELRIGLDPSVGDVAPAPDPSNGGAKTTETVSKGCSTTPGSSGSAAATDGFLVIVGLVLLVLGRRRRS